MISADMALVVESQSQSDRQHGDGLPTRSHILISTNAITKQQQQLQQQQQNQSNNTTNVRIPFFWGVNLYFVQFCFVSIPFH